MNRRGLFAVLGLFLTFSACQPAFGVNILLITDSSGSLTTVESNIKTNLQAAGYTVNTLWDGDSQANYTAAFANNDAVYIPSDVSATDMGTKLRTCPVGIINELTGYMDDIGLCTSAGSTSSSSTVTISTNSHYITSPFPTGSPPLASVSYNVAKVGGTTASGATILATLSGTNAIVCVDTGGTLANTINSNSTASGRRVQMPLQCGVIDTTTL